MGWGCGEEQSTLVTDTQGLGPAVSIQDVDAAMAARSMGRRVVDEIDDGVVGPLRKLKNRPAGAAQAWSDAFHARVMSGKLKDQVRLLRLAGALCMEGTREELQQVALLPIAAWPSNPTADELRELEAQEQIRSTAFGAVGSLAGAQCVSDGGTQEDGFDFLEGVLFDNSLPSESRRLAGEELLKHAPARAALLRAELIPSEDWMLTPFEERRVDPVVDEIIPPRPQGGRTDIEGSASTSAGQGSSAPEQMEHRLEASTSAFDDSSIVALDQPSPNSTCSVTVAVGWPSVDSHDAFVSQKIALNQTWYGHESCTQFANRYDSEIGLQDNTWDEGFGINDKCNNTKPFGRMINAAWVLEHASANPTSSGSYSGAPIDYGYDFVTRETPEFEGTCNRFNGFDAQYHSCTWWESLWGCDERIEMNLDIWQHSVVLRASTLLHEARHAYGYTHTSSASCPRGVSCDEQYSSNGANTVEVQWLAQYYRVGQYSNSEMRATAIDRANAVLRLAFETCPDVQLDSSGYFYSTPGICP